MSESLQRLIHLAAVLLTSCVIGCAATSLRSVAQQADAADRGVAPRNDASPPGEASGDRPVSEPRRAAERAYARAREAMLGETKLDAGTIWNLRQGLGHRPDRQLSAFLDARAAELAGTRNERLVNPLAPRVELPVEPGSGIERIVNMSMAPLGRPEQRAIAWITEYATPDASDYTLTHQFLYIEWGEATGLELPATLTARKQSLLGRVAAEQAAARRFSDLYAERVAILMLYSRPARSDVTHWIETLVGKQLDNGHWDSQGSDSGQGNYHTTSLCMTALTVYLGDDPGS